MQQMRSPSILGSTSSAVIAFIAFVSSSAAAAADIVCQNAEGVGAKGACRRGARRRRCALGGGRGSARCNAVRGTANAECLALCLVLPVTARGDARPPAGGHEQRRGEQSCALEDLRNSQVVDLRVRTCTFRINEANGCVGRDEQYISATGAADSASARLRTGAREHEVYLSIHERRSALRHAHPSCGRVGRSSQSTGLPRVTRYATRA